MSLSTTPRATARLQFHKGFTLDDAVAVVPYLDTLGISHLYASPLLTAQPGSSHGYDIIDPGAINPELGGLPALRRLVAALRGRGMGLLLDIVPNHMGVGGTGNRWWQDVLEFGRRSRYAHYFDIDWTPPDPALRDRILVPLLGANYGETLRAGTLALALDRATGGLICRYHEHEFPLSPRSTAALLRHVPGAAALSRAFAHAAAQASPAAEAARAKAALLAFHAEHAAALGAVLQDFSAPARLHALLRRQHYRLAWWRTAAAEINWRRFFDINTLAGIRVELPDVFHATHDFLLELYAQGLIDGVRIDHVDGLTDPGAYLRKLRRAMAAAAPARPPDAAQGPPYIVVEKILAAGEALEPRWRADGTTGYDFMAEVGAVLHDPAGEAPLTRLWEEVSGQLADFPACEEQARRQILRDNLASEVNSLAVRLHDLARQNCLTADFTLHVIRQTLEELLAHFPVYRIYARATPAGPADTAMFDRAEAAAARRLRKADLAVLAMLRRWLLEDDPRAHPPGARRAGLLRARAAFQQLSAPVAAKSVEDTAFYRYGRLLSRNEVGANPGRFSLSAEEFHAAVCARGAAFPGALLATATHDHKRGEDTRARLAVLSEIPGEWKSAVRRWRRLNAVLREQAGPSPADELMLYQMLVAGWPLTLAAGNRAGIEAYGRRVAAWQQKSVREAKRLSEWAAPDAAYEGAAERFLFGCLDAQRPMLYELIAFANRIAPAGAVNGLAQVLLRHVAPGVPDLYQGTEFWDQSFVDPDNRQSVDFAARAAALAKGGLSFAQWRSGAVKQALIARLLAVRREHPGLFAHGQCDAPPLEGAMAGHALALRRRWEGAEIIAVATRFAGPFMVRDPLLPQHAWGDTALIAGAGSWRDLLSNSRPRGGPKLALGPLLGRLPVALLWRQ